MPKKTRNPVFADPDFDDETDLTDNVADAGAVSAVIEVAPRESAASVPAAPEPTLNVERMHQIHAAAFESFFRLDADRVRLPFADARNRVHSVAAERINTVLAPIAQKHFDTDSDWLSLPVLRERMQKAREEADAATTESAKLADEIEAAISQAADPESLYLARMAAEGMASSKGRYAAQLAETIAEREQASREALEARLTAAYDALKVAALAEVRDREAALLAAIAPLVCDLEISRRIMRGQADLLVKSLLRPPTEV